MGMQERKMQLHIQQLSTHHLQQNCWLKIILKSYPAQSWLEESMCFSFEKSKIKSHQGDIDLFRGIQPSKRNKLMQPDVQMTITCSQSMSQLII